MEEDGVRRHSLSTHTIPLSCHQVVCDALSISLTYPISLSCNTVDSDRRKMRRGCAPAIGDSKGNETFSDNSSCLLTYKRRVRGHHTQSSKGEETLMDPAEKSVIQTYKRRVRMKRSKPDGILEEKDEPKTRATSVISARELRQPKQKAGSVVLVCGHNGDDESESHEPWTVLTHKKPQQGWVAYNPRTMRPPNPLEGKKSVKVMSWNVNGLRSLLKMEVSSALQLARREDFDILCLQETKLQEKDVEAVGRSLIEGYDSSFWACSVSKLGYSGTAIISRMKPLSVTYGLGVEGNDGEGRLITAEFDTFYLLSAYVPNSGEALKRLQYRVTQWDPALADHMKELEKSKPVILTGDLNCAHQEIDIFNPAGNRRNAGFTDEERESFNVNFLSKGFVDTFRKQHPGIVGYTYWGYRHGARKLNKGWRLDYCLVSECIADAVHDSYVLPDIIGSDHCPIGMVLKL